MIDAEWFKSALIVIAVFQSMRKTKEINRLEEIFLQAAENDKEKLPAIVSYCFTHDA